MKADGVIIEREGKIVIKCIHHELPVLLGHRHTLYILYICTLFLLSDYHPVLLDNLLTLSHFITHEEAKAQRS